MKTISVVTILVLGGILLFILASVVLNLSKESSENTNQTDFNEVTITNTPEMPSKEIKPVTDTPKSEKPDPLAPYGGSLIDKISNESGNPVVEREAEPEPEKPKVSQPVETKDVETTNGIHNPNNLNTENISQKIHIYVNEHRENNGLESLSYDSKLAVIATFHSEDMSENNYFAHESMNGDEPSDRADNFNYRCHKELGGGWYTEGIAENIAQNYVNTLWTTYYNDVPHYNWLTEDELAEALFEQWKTSPGHNENMLEENYDREGLGIAINSDGKVYATQNFC